VLTDVYGRTCSLWCWKQRLSKRRYIHTRTRGVNWQRRYSGPSHTTRSCGPIQPLLIISGTDRSSVLFSPVRHHYQQYRPFIYPVQSSSFSLAVQTIHLSCSVQSVLIRSTDRSSVLFSPARHNFQQFSPVHPHYQQYRPFIYPVQSSSFSLAVQTIHLSCSVQSVLIISSTDQSSVLFTPVRPHYQQYRPIICPVQSSPSSLSAVQTVHLSCSVQSILIISSTDCSSVLFSPVRPHYQQYRQTHLNFLIPLPPDRLQQSWKFVTQIFIWTANSHVRCSYVLEKYCERGNHVARSRALWATTDTRDIKLCTYEKTFRVFSDIAALECKLLGQNECMTERETEYYPKSW